MSHSSFTKSRIGHPSKPCHNCRRKRLRCDRSLPGCYKCSSKGEECLGYGLLLRWTNAAAVGEEAQGVGTHYGPHELKVNQKCILQKCHLGIGTSVVLNDWFVKFSLVDPLLQDLGYRNKLYVNHCKFYRAAFALSFILSLRKVHYLTSQDLVSTTVCQDLVSFDQNDHTNPFRSALTLMGEYDFLQEIILATSAIHIATLRRSRGIPVRQELADALAARGRAYRLLRQALANLSITSSQRAIVLIAVVFFINFDLIDSGHGSWMPHMEAAGSLMTSLGNLNEIPPFIARLADVVVADCLAYHILGSTLASVEGAAIKAFEGIDIGPTLQKAAAYSYHCSPPFVLGILSKACRLSVQDVKEAEFLLHLLRNYDVASWVQNLEGLPVIDDIQIRISLASAHRAAACLIVALIVPKVSMNHLDGCHILDFLYQELFGHLSAIPIEHALAKGVIWPTFMAGAQANDAPSRQWCLERMQTMWYSTPWICPWGYIESAITMMQDVWNARDQRERDGVSDGLNWLQELRGLKGHCLIV